MLIWDVAADKLIKIIDGHSGRLGALAWTGDTVLSGSREGRILQHDV
jgi:hypothetical protein